MSLLDRLTGRQALIQEIQRLRQEVRLLRESAGSASSTSAGLTSISGLNAKILQLSRDGVVRYANTPMVATLGRSKQQVIGKRIEEIDEMPWGKGHLAVLVRRALEVGGQEPVEEVKDYADGKSDRRRYEIVKVIAQGDRVQILIEDITDLKNLEESFKRYVSPAVIEKMKGLQQDFFRAERYEMTVLFADLRGFTPLSEQLPPEEVRLTLNSWLSKMTEAIESQEGTVDKYVGDEVMALFGAPIFYEDHAERAVRVALEMQRAHAELMNFWQSQGKAAVPMGVAINSGEMVIGNIGSRRRVEYTVIGYPVNLASRLCGIAEGGQILLGGATLARLITRKAPLLSEMEVERRDQVKVKGLSQAIDTFLVRAK